MGSVNRYGRPRFIERDGNMTKIEQKPQSEWINILAFYDDLVQEHQWLSADPLRKLVHILSRHPSYNQLYPSHSHAILIISTVSSWPERLDSPHLAISFTGTCYKYELLDIMFGKPRRLELGSADSDILFSKIISPLDYLFCAMQEIHEL